MNPARDLVPMLPESAPFTVEQRAYLNGFFAGLFSRVPSAHGAAPAPPEKTLEPLTILFGSQTGNCETLAKRIAREAGKRGFAATVHDLASYPAAQLASEPSLLIVTSTYGDGEPPDNAKAFQEFLNHPSAPRLPLTKYSVCALGDSNYARFCGFGRELDLQLEKLGAARVHPRADCDVEYEAEFGTWLDSALTKLAAGRAVALPAPSALPAALESVGTAPAAGKPSIFGRHNPFPAPLLTNHKLNLHGSAKETRHFEFSLAGSDLAYEAGDALAVRPQNCPILVRELLAVLGCSGAESVLGGNGAPIRLQEALLCDFEITRIPPALLKVVAEQTGDGMLNQLAGPGVNGELTQYLRGREIIDLLHAHPAAKLSAAEFVPLLKRLQPRLYSISSSPKAHPGEVHLTINVVRYEAHGRSRKGVCSSFLADRVAPKNGVPVFVHSNQAFRIPNRSDTPMIMIGPGTGIAPFRAFLEERQAVGATGKNWLFFGDQKSSTDFLYREEMEDFLMAGVLTRLDLAWSRDQSEKVYVQQRLLEQGQELWNWLEQGAAIYVCGDASRMAKDVDATLQEVIRQGGSKTPEQAAEYVAALKAARRYQRDVY